MTRSRRGVSKSAINIGIGVTGPQVSDTIISEAISQKLTNEKIWTDKLRYLDEFKVLKSVFKYVDVKQLKICRFVNKLWNVEACSALRKLSYVRLFENIAEELDGFRKLYEDTRIKGTPCPFERIHFSSGQLKSENMDLFLYNSKTYIENFYVHEPPTSYKVDFQRHLYQILMRNASTLKKFHCAMADGINFGLLSDKQRVKLSLPALTEFGYWESMIGPKPFSLSFIIEVLNGAPNLKNFHPKILNDRNLTQILKKTNTLCNLEELYIQSMGSSHFNLLTKLKLPHLKILSVQVNRNAEKENKVPSETLQTIVGNFAESLEDLSISWVSNTPDVQFPRCPRLSNLIIDDWMGSLGVFDKKTLPSLKSMHKIYHRDFPYESVLSPHDGVEYFTLEDHISHSVPAQLDFLQTMEEEYTYYLEYINVQYPNLKSLDLTLPLSNSLMMSIIRIFPRLEILALENTFSCFSLHEQIFTGMNKHTLSRYLNAGQNPSDYSIPQPRMPSLIDMKSIENYQVIQLYYEFKKDLKMLVLARYSRGGFPVHMMITDAAIKYGISKMPKLEFLQFNWNPELTVSTVAQSLKHLPRIVITDAYRFHPFRILEEFRKRVPQVELE